MLHQTLNTRNDHEQKINSDWSYAKNNMIICNFLPVFINA